MTFSNAYHGVKKVFTAELLKLIGGVCLLIASILGVLTAGVAADGATVGAGVSGAGTIIFMAAGLVLPIVGYIMNLVGLHQAGKDEDGFRTAFIVSIFALIIAVIAGIFTGFNIATGVADNIATVIQRICEIIVFVMVVGGVASLAARLGKENMIGNAKTVLTIFIVCWVINILASLVDLIFGVNDTTATITGIASIVVAVFSIIGYVVYLVFLGKAKNMLRDN